MTTTTTTTIEAVEEALVRLGALTTRQLAEQTGRPATMVASACQYHVHTGRLRIQLRAGRSGVEALWSIPSGSQVPRSTLALRVQIARAAALATPLYRMEGGQLVPVRAKEMEGWL